MSATIHALLAEELDISKEKAQKLMSAMLREVKKRALKQEGGVHLPELGQFTIEDGELAFSPSDSLSRAVNHRFEGLETEDLANAPGKEQEDSKENDEGPSTITLGYQDGSNWSPVEEDESEATESSSDDDAPDTAEFQAPDSSEDAAPDTDEIQASGSDAQDADTDASEGDPAPERDSREDARREDARPAEASPNQPASTTEPEASSEPDASPAEEENTESPPHKTEELYPLVDDVDVTGSSDSETDDSPVSEPGTDDPSSVEDPDEHDELSGIWDEVEQETQEISEASSQKEFDAGAEDDGFSFPSPGESSPDDTTAAEEESSDSASSASPDEKGSEESEPEESTFDPDPAPSTPPTAATMDDSGTSAVRVGAAVLVFLLLGGGAWYILGQRGLIQGPSTTMSAVIAPTESSSPSGNPSSASEEEQSSEAAEPAETQEATTAETTPEASASSGSAADSPESDSPDDAAESETSEAANDSEDSSDGQATASQGITPAEGGWSLIVASRADRNAASELVATYQDRFGDQQLPIDIIEATVDNATRYRVGIGQFSSRSEAEGFLNQYQSDLPDGAWAAPLK